MEEQCIIKGNALPRRSDTRNSNIELLRIVSMVMIVSGHFWGQGQVKENTSDMDYLVLSVLGNGQRVAINIFLLISSWFLVDQRFAAKRVIKIWLEVFFYTTAITIFLLIAGADISIKVLVQSFLPVLGRPLWFASAYIALLLLCPFLEKIKLLSKQRHRALVIITGLIICVIPSTASEMDTYLCAIAWIIFVYIFVGYFKEKTNIITSNLSGIIYIFIGASLYILLAIISVIRVDGTLADIVQKLAIRFLHDFKSVPNFLISLLIFRGVITLRSRNSKIVNYIASGSFAVYIVHQTPALYPLLWRWIKETFLFERESIAPAFIASVILIYVVVSCVDLLRASLLEANIMNTNFIKMLCSKLNDFYG